MAWHHQPTLGIAEYARFDTSVRGWLLFYSLSAFVTNYSFWSATARAYYPIVLTSRHAVTRGVPHGGHSVTLQLPIRRARLMPVTSITKLYGSIPAVWRSFRHLVLPILLAAPPPSSTYPHGGSLPPRHLVFQPRPVFLRHYGGCLLCHRLPPYLRAILLFTFQPRLPQALPLIPFTSLAA